jgi:hypothetical protein
MIKARQLMAEQFVGKMTVLKIVLPINHSVI